ncbi:hypothetical protein AKJ16_DCAP00075 [Drosera capensis]
MVNDMDIMSTCGRLDHKLTLHIVKFAAVVDPDPSASVHSPAAHHLAPLSIPRVPEMGVWITSFLGSSAG